MNFKAIFFSGAALTMLLSQSLANELNIFGEWLPSGTASISVTGPIEITPTILIIDNKMRLMLSHPQQIDAYHALGREVRKAIEFTVTGPSTIPLVRGNVLCPSPAKRVIFWLEHNHSLGMVLSTSENPPMSYDHTPCGYLGYTRKPKQNIS